MSRSFQGLAFRAGRNDTPFLYAQQMQQQGIKNEQLQKKRSNELADKSLKWQQELVNTDYAAINLTADKYVQEKAKGIFDRSTELVKNSPGGIISPEDMSKLESDKFNLKQNHTFLQSATNAFIDANKNTVGGSNSKLYNQAKASQELKDAFENEMIVDGEVNRSFDPTSFYDIANKYDNLKIPAVVDNFLSTMSKTITSESKLSNGLKIDTLIESYPFALTETDAKGNITFAKDENAQVKVKITPDFLAFADSDEYMKIAIDGKQSEVLESTGNSISRQQALEFVMKENNPTKYDKNISKDPNATNDKDDSQQFDLSINSSDDAVYVDDKKVKKTGVAGFNSIYFDMPQKFTKQLLLDTEDLDGKRVNGKFTPTKIGSDGQGREYIAVSQVETGGTVRTQNIPFNEKNIKLIRNNLAKSTYLEPFNKAVEELQSEFDNKKSINVNPNSFNFVASEIKTLIENTSREGIAELFERYGINTDQLKVKEGTYWNSGEFYLEAGESTKGIGNETMWSTNSEDMMRIANMLYNSDPKKYAKEFGSREPQQVNQEEGPTKAERQETL